MQTKIMKEYIFYQVGAIVLYQQLHFICSPYFSTRYFNDIGRIHKNSNLPSNSLVTDIFLYYHVPCFMGV